MTKFRKGDHVRVIARRSYHFDQVGTVAEIDSSQHFSFGVSGLDRPLLWYGPNELILAEHQMQEAP
jgi:hypothetical protein